MKAFRTLAALLTTALLFTAPQASAKKEKEAAPEAEPAALPTVAEKTKGLEKRDGFLTFYLDRKAGQVWLELPPPADDGEVVELIYLEGLVRGLGSNPVGLDRGQLSGSKLLTVRRLGPRVLFEQRNMRFRADTDNAAERKATEQSFATSVIWGQAIGALDANGRSLVDLSSFLVRDAHGVSRTLRNTEQGAFSLDPERSAIDFASCLAFPDNVVFEAVLTFTSEEPGPQVQSTAPTAEAVTLVQHHGLIRLPDDGYQVRRFDPRIGMLSISFQDYGVGLADPIRRRLVTRHRLQKVDPTAARSAVEEPIVYYVDPGAPEPVRSALLDGARWWAAAFEQAGFIDAYRVELLPPDAHPLDVRYNVIQWVHRATRGWSYGSGIIDPRTGEIIKGHVSLGSLRVRQDRLLFEGLAGTAQTGTGAADDPIQLALARIRQLAAHEVGHTLGITHNFAASTYGRASVMDYPAPLITVDADGELDFSAAYDVGVGAWDIHTIRWGYSQWMPEADEEAALEALTREGLAAGLLFITDEDARPPGAADPRGNLWDNGADAVEALELALRVRRIGLARFGEENVRPGIPLAELQEVLAPLYFHHRYQLDAALKVVAGLETTYAVRGDGQVGARIIDGARQRRALGVLLGILSPAQLDLPEDVLTLLPPRPFGLDPNPEMFATATWPAFDALGAAATAADSVVAGLVQPQRLARLVDFHRRDPALPGVEEVLRALLEQAFGNAATSAASTPRAAALVRVVQRVVVDRLLAGAATAETSAEGQAWLRWALETARGRLSGAASSTAQRAHRQALVARIDRFLNRTEVAATPLPLPAAPPPGSPIGLIGAQQQGCDGPFLWAPAPTP